MCILTRNTTAIHIYIYLRRERERLRVAACSRWYSSSCRVIVLNPTESVTAAVRALDEGKATAPAAVVVRDLLVVWKPNE